MDQLAWGCPEFAAELHRWFLNHIKNGSVDDLKFEPALIALNRTSINCFSWVGEDFAEFGGIVLDDDEEYLSVIKPRELGKVNSICGATIVSHFAFYPQREQLDSGGLLDAYASLVQTSEHRSIVEICHTVSSLSAPERKDDSLTGMGKVSKRLTKYIRLPWCEWVSAGEFYRRFMLLFKKKEPRYWLK